MKYFIPRHVLTLKMHCLAQGCLALGSKKVVTVALRKAGWDVTLDEFFNLLWLQFPHLQSECVNFTS